MNHQNKKLGMRVDRYMHVRFNLELLGYSFGFVTNKHYFWKMLDAYQSQWALR